jgi:cell pole-organizing protein PopZ
MSAEGTAAPPGATADQSMEDILASIRRILNEDEAPPAEAPAAPPQAAPAPVPAAAAPATEAAPDGPLLLTEEMMVGAEPPAPEPAPEAPPAAASPPTPAPAPPEAGFAEGLVAPAVAAAAAASVSQLFRAVSTDRAATVTRGGPSIEDVVREELRPLLKDWLDQHLPGIVERLVRAEIERVVGRALT